jgi:hypothetical protein
MANSNLSSIEGRKVERKTLKERARVLLRTPSSFYPVSDSKKKTRAVIALREASDEIPVHRNFSFMEELQESVSIEFDLKDSTPGTLLKSTQAIESAQHVKQLPDYNSIVMVVVVTLALVACCMRSAIFCRKFTTQVSIGKQVTVKTLQDTHDSGARNTASEGEEKHSLEEELKNTARGKEEQHGLNVLDTPSHISSTEEKGEDLPPQLIFEVARSAIDTIRQFSSAESTTASTVFSLSTAGETKDDDNCSIDTETAGDSAKMASLCTSPIKVQEFERNLTDESNPTTTNISTASFDKKRSMLKETPDVPIEDVKESAVLGKDAQAIFGVAMKVAMAVVAVNVLVLTRRR